MGEGKQSRLTFRSLLKQVEINQAAWSGTKLPLEKKRDYSQTISGDD